MSHSMATVRQLMDDLAARRKTVEQLATDFRTRKWPAPKPRPTDAQAYGVEDDARDDDPNSWSAVQNDSRVSIEHYKTLFDAYQAAART